MLLALANILASIVPRTGRGVDDPSEKILRLLTSGTFRLYNSLKVRSSIRSTDAPESTIISISFPSILTLQVGSLSPTIL